jgi:hypothetical protein
MRPSRGVLGSLLAGFAPPRTGDPRFELGLTDSESVVLPLHQSPLDRTRIIANAPQPDLAAGHLVYQF